MLPYHRFICQYKYDNKGQFSINQKCKESNISLSANEEIGTVNTRD